MNLFSSLKDKSLQHKQDKLSRVARTTPFLMNRSNGISHNGLIQGFPTWGPHLTGGGEGAYFDYWMGGNNSRMSY